VTLIEKLTSGFPVFVITAQPVRRLLPDNASNWNRPDIVGDPNKAGPVAANPGLHSAHDFTHGWHWLLVYPCAFERRAENWARETAPRSMAPIMFNTDFSSLKRSASRRESDWISARNFNLFNHAQFGTPQQ